MQRDLLRWDDWSHMKDLLGELRKCRVDDKQAFKNSSNIVGGSPSKDSRASPTKAFRPLSEPSSVNKKNLNYRIKNKQINIKR